MTDRIIRENMATLSAETLGKLPYKLLRRHMILPICEDECVLYLRCATYASLGVVDELRVLLGKAIEVEIASEQEILAGLNLLFDDRGVQASELISQIQVAPRLEEMVEDVLDDDQAAPVIRLLNLILKEAIDEGVSDVHLEPREHELHIRYRVDGVLQLRHTPSTDVAYALLMRIKVLAKLDIAEHRLPQDGRLKLTIAAREVDMRVSTVPTIYGERLVLRILDQRNVVLEVSSLGMSNQVRQMFEQLITMNEGMILVTGPTGSGKTTTLYSALTCLSKSTTMNIMTIEDPPEYKLLGISQIAVKPKIGLHFAQGLRHLLRQDPDILMVGEIRDTETAEIAVQAALTGHLLLSTLHTNDAIAAIPRLLDMGIEPYLLSSTLVGVVAQRLVRKLCIHCRKSRSLSGEEHVFLEQLGYHEHPNQIWDAVGCSACMHQGYKHRCGIYEIFCPDREMQSDIASGASQQHLRSQWVAKGFRPLLFHGLELVFQGITTLEEVLRVTKRMD